MANAGQDSGSRSCSGWPAAPAIPSNGINHTAGMAVERNSAKGKKITAEALELADAHGVTISTDIGHYRAGVRRRAAICAVRATRQLGAHGPNCTFFY
jgi:hypothetical protein